MVGLLGGEGVVAKLHPPKRGPLCPCRFCLSAYGDLRAIRVSVRRALATSACARMSIRPKRAALLAIPSTYLAAGMYGFLARPIQAADPWAAVHRIGGAPAGRTTDTGLA